MLTQQLEYMVPFGFLLNNIVFHYLISPPGLVLRQDGRSFVSGQKGGRPTWHWREVVPQAELGPEIL